MSSPGNGAMTLVDRGILLLLGEREREMGFLILFFSFMRSTIFTLHYTTLHYSTTRVKEEEEEEEEEGVFLYYHYYYHSSSCDSRF